MKPFTAIILIIAAWNLAVFFLYAADKRRAVTGKWRISEGTLLGAALCAGGLGALCAMRVFRHKTRHMRFQILLPLAALLTCALLVLLYRWTH